MNKYNYEYSENDYKTPPELYGKALNYFRLKYSLFLDCGFNLDVCCTDENIPALRYYKNGDKDGLKEEWSDFSWCNPPFNECRKWIEKAYKENKENGVKIAMLIPVRTETKYWHDYILFNPNVKIEWLRKGYKFLDKHNEEMGVFKNALALVYFE